MTPLLVHYVVVSCFMTPLLVHYAVVLLLHDTTTRALCGHAPAS